MQYFNALISQSESPAPEWILVDTAGSEATQGVEGIKSAPNAAYQFEEHVIDGDIAFMDGGMPSRQNSADAQMTSPGTLKT